MTWPTRWVRTHLRRITTGGGRRMRSTCLTSKTASSPGPRPSGNGGFIRPSIATTSSCCTTASTRGPSPQGPLKGPGHRFGPDHPHRGDEGRHLRREVPRPAPGVRPLPQAGERPGPRPARRHRRGRRRPEGEPDAGRGVSWPRVLRGRAEARPVARPRSALVRRDLAAEDDLAEILGDQRPPLLSEPDLSRGSRSLLQAMATGCVVLGQRRSAHVREDRSEPGVDGLLAPPERTRRLARAGEIEVLDDPAGHSPGMGAVSAGGRARAVRSRGHLA